jgi:hypothetical protein
MQVLPFELSKLLSGVVVMSMALTPALSEAGDYLGRIVAEREKKDGKPYACIYIYVCVYIYIYIYTHTLYTYLHTHSLTHKSGTYACADMLRYSHTHRHACP